MPRRAPSLNPRPVAAPRRKWAVTSKGSRHERGYGTEWDKRRARILKRDKGLCQACVKRNRITAATDVDHVVPKHKGGDDGDDNLQSLCRDCHKAKTALEGQANRHG